MMTATRPRVTAADSTPAFTIEDMCGPSYTTPGVEITVSFDLHDHRAALEALDAVVARVRAQIEEVQ